MAIFRRKCRAHTHVLAPPSQFTRGNSGQVRKACNFCTQKAGTFCVGCSNKIRRYKDASTSTTDSQYSRLLKDKKEPIAFRFHLLIKFLSNNLDESMDMGLLGRLFWVHPLGDNHRQQCVLVLPNGSFASSSGDFASYGRPDVYCWAVIARGHAYFNPFFHLHFVSNDSRNDDSSSGPSNNGTARILLEAF